MAQVVQYNYVVHRILSSGKAVFDVAFETIDWIFHYNFDGIYFFGSGSQVYNLRQRNSLKYKIVQLYSENFTIHSIFRKKNSLIVFL